MEIHQQVLIGPTVAEKQHILLRIQKNLIWKLPMLQGVSQYVPVPTSLRLW
jgi:hypothetical protein